MTDEINKKKIDKIQKSDKQLNKGFAISTSVTSKPEQSNPEGFTKGGIVYPSDTKKSKSKEETK